MIGRQVLITNRAFTLEELNEFMNQNWNREEFNDFYIGRPTPASVEEYIILPCTERFCVITYSRKAGLFSKDNKVVLTVCDTPEGVKDSVITSIPTKNVFYGAYKIGKIKNKEDERKGPAEEILLKYTEHMKGLLDKAGYLK